MKKWCIFIVAVMQSLLLESQDIKTFTVWSRNDYSAFTSLVHYNRRFYCVFRESDSHIGSSGNNGIIRIMSSRNGKHWRKFLTFSDENIDFRDPKLSVTPDNRMMLLTECVTYDGNHADIRQSKVSFIHNKSNYSQLQPIQLNYSKKWNWLWDITWADGMSYGFTYVPYFSFVKSKDGVNFENVQISNVEGKPNEVALTQYGYGLVAVVRRESLPALVGFVSMDNLSDWKWFETSYNIAGPCIIVINDDIYISGRSYFDGERVTLFRWNESLNDLEVVRHITDPGDCSYPGMVYNKNKLYVSYYWGSHKQTEILMEISSIVENNE